MRNTLYTIIFILLSQNTANADEIESKLQFFFSTFTGYMNEKKPHILSDFLLQNSDKDLKIKKKIIKINGGSSDLNNFTIEELEMDLTEYEIFLTSFFEQISAYAINHKISNFSYNSDEDTIFATVEYTEYATIRTRDAATKKIVEQPIYINSNCSYSFSNTSGLPRLYHNICVEKMVRNELSSETEDKTKEEK